MAVTITAPASRVASRSGGVRVAWTPEYPQSAYEVLYRRKGEQAWNTFGRVASTENSAELDLSAFDDFSEYHYRVVCYAEDAASGTTIYSGSDSSAAYSLVVVPEKKLAAAKVRYGDGMEEVPVYEDAAAEECIRVALPGGRRGTVPLGAADHALASGLRVDIGGEVKAALGGEGHFAPSGVQAGADMAVKSRYSYNYTNPSYTYYYRYSWSNPTYYYSYRYSYVNPTYYYRYQYSVTSAVYYTKTAYSYKTPVTYYRYSYTYVSAQASTGYYFDYNALAEYRYYYYKENWGGTDSGMDIYYYRVYKSYTIPATYKTGYGYYTAGGATGYGYYYTKKGGVTTYGYAYAEDGGGAEAGYKYALGGGGTSYGYRSANGGGGTGYGYTSAVGGGGTGIGYGYTVEHRYR